MSGGGASVVNHSAGKLDGNDEPHYRQPNPSLDQHSVDYKRFELEPNGVQPCSSSSSDDEPKANAMNKSHDHQPTTPLIKSPSKDPSSTNPSPTTPTASNGTNDGEIGTYHANNHVPEGFTANPTSSYVKWTQLVPELITQEAERTNSQYCQVGVLLDS